MVVALAVSDSTDVLLAVGALVDKSTNSQCDGETGGGVCVFLWQWAVVSGNISFRPIKSHQLIRNGRDEGWGCVVSPPLQSFNEHAHTIKILHIDRHKKWAMDICIGRMYKNIMFCTANKEAITSNNNHGM